MATQIVEVETQEWQAQQKLVAAPVQAKIHGCFITTKVVGVSFEGRQEIVARLRIGDRVWLERDASNPFDFNAIRVCRSNGEQFGYLNRFLAANITPWFDAYGKPVKGKVHLLTGSALDGYTLGVIVIFKLPKLHPNHRVQHRSLNQWEDEEGGQNE